MDIVEIVVERLAQRLRELSIKEVPVRTGFYFTYEELKREWVIPLCLTIFEFLLYLWGIETRAWPNSRPWKSDSFYFTYEELKRFGDKGTLSPLYVFLLYLWGIETPSGQEHEEVHWGFYFTYEELKLS